VEVETWDPARGATVHAGVRVPPTHETFVYTGKIEYRGTSTKENIHRSFDFGPWQEMNIALSQTNSKNEAASPQNTMRFCRDCCFAKSCQRPMIQLIRAKAAAATRYYVCQGARQNGWKSCSTKSVSATLIEDSLMSQLRARLNADHTRLALKIPDREWQAYPGSDERIRQQDR